MRTEVTLLHRAAIFIEVQRIVRTRLHARPATDACVAIDIYYSIGAFLKCIHRTDRHAWRVGAVIAAQHRKMAPHRGERAALDVLHPRAEVADGHIVLGFARNSTGVAADAAIVINEKAILHGG